MIYRSVFREVEATPVEHEGAPYMVVTAGVRVTVVSREAFELLYEVADLSGEAEPLVPPPYGDEDGPLARVQVNGAEATKIADAVAGVKRRNCHLMPAVLAEFGYELERGIWFELVKGGKTTEQLMEIKWIFGKYSALSICNALERLRKLGIAGIGDTAFANVWLLK
ncbi:MAG: hypothetical protein QM757_16665 [Paludibaculum sp.]